MRRPLLMDAQRLVFFLAYHFTVNQTSACNGSDLCVYVVVGRFLGAVNLFKQC